MSPTGSQHDAVAPGEALFDIYDYVATARAGQPAKGERQSREARIDIDKWLWLMSALTPAEMQGWLLFLKHARRGADGTLGLAGFTGKWLMEQGMSKQHAYAAVRGLAAKGYTEEGRERDEEGRLRGKLTVLRGGLVGGVSEGSLPEHLVPQPGRKPGSSSPLRAVKSQVPTSSHMPGTGTGDPVDNPVSPTFQGLECGEVVVSSPQVRTTFHNEGTSGLSPSSSSVEEEKNFWDGSSNAMPRSALASLLFDPALSARVATSRVLLAARIGSHLQGAPDRCTSLLEWMADSRYPAEAGKSPQVLAQMLVDLLGASGSAREVEWVQLASILRSRGVRWPQATGLGSVVEGWVAAVLTAVDKRDAIKSYPGWFGGRINSAEPVLAGRTCRAVITLLRTDLAIGERSASPGDQGSPSQALPEQSLLRRETDPYVADEPDAGRGDYEARVRAAAYRSSNWNDETSVEMLLANPRLAAQLLAKDEQRLSQSAG